MYKRQAHYKADVVILTNDNPRTEAPEDIIDDIVDGFPRGDHQKIRYLDLQLPGGRGAGASSVPLPLGCHACLLAALEYSGALFLSKQ